jgi:hypothetical protein
MPTDNAIARSARFSILYSLLRSGTRTLPKRAGHVVHQLSERPGQGRATSNEADTDTRRGQEAPPPSIRLAEPPPGPVPDHAAPEPATGGEAHGAWARLAHPEQHERRAFHPGPPPEQLIEFGPGPEPLSPRKHRAGGRRPRHGASRRVDAAPWRADASAPFGRLWSPSARGTHASWPAGDDSVGTSASRVPPHGRDAHSRPSYRRAHNAVKRRGPLRRAADPLLAERAPCYGGPPGPGSEQGDALAPAPLATPRPVRTIERVRRGQPLLPELSTAVDKCVCNLRP